MKSSLHLHLHPDRISYMCVTATIAHIHSTKNHIPPSPKKGTKKKRKNRKENDILRNSLKIQKHSAPTRIHPLAITEKRNCCRYVITYSFVLRLMTPDEDAMFL